MKRITTIHLEGTMPKPKAVLEPTSSTQNELTQVANTLLHAQIQDIGREIHEERKERKPRRPRMVALIDSMQTRINTIEGRIAALTSERNDLLTAITSLSK
jgi:hypothetical protein